MLAMLRASLFGPRIPEPSPAPAAAQPARPSAVENGPSQGLSREATPEVLRQAFEYRGHVTLEVAGSDPIEGYVANLGEAHLDLWMKADGKARRIPTGEVRRVVFSGRDPAAGGSYETWLRKQAARAEAGVAGP
jgi:hypothetical protein